MARRCRCLSHRTPSAVGIHHTPEGGNPAGVWIGPSLPDPTKMLGIAADVGFSETAFLAVDDNGTWTTRYYSPQAEVPFCGHATIASGVLLGSIHGPGSYTLATAVGEVPVEVRVGPGGIMVATLTSVEPVHREVPADVLNSALEALAWASGDLDTAVPPAFAYAGAWHLVMAVAEHDTLRRVDLDAAFSALGALMKHEDLITLQLIWRRDETTFHARNPFPPGGVVEDPATGAAAAALGGYLRAIGAVDVPAGIVIYQGDELGRPSLLEVRILEGGGIKVGGSAVPLSSGSSP